MECIKSENQKIRQSGVFSTYLSTGIRNSMENSRYENYDVGFRQQETGINMPDQVDLTQVGAKPTPS